MAESNQISESSTKYISPLLNYRISTSKNTSEVPLVETNSKKRFKTGRFSCILRTFDIYCGKETVF